MTSIIVECRQLNNDSIVMADGDYITTLSENILLEENDQILIRNGFIDTVPISNEFIELVEDYTITANFLYYQYNYSAAGKSVYDNFAYQGFHVIGGTPQQTFNGQSVSGSIIGNIANLTKQHLISTTDFAVYESIKFFRDDDGQKGNWGNVPFDFHYYNFLGVEEIYHGILPSLPNGESQTTVTIGKIIANQTVASQPFLVITPQNVIKSRVISDYNNPAYFNKTGISTGTLVFEPIIGTQSGIIPKGKYAPEEIASRISKIFQEATPSSPFDIKATNNLLITSGTDTPDHKFIMNCNSEIYRDQLKAVNNDFNDDGNFNGVNANQYVPVYNFNNSSNTQVYWVGTSQFDVQYDDQSNKFFIEYLHMPYYGTATKGVQTEEIITINKNDFVKGAGPNKWNANAFQQEFFYTKANSGIALTSLTSSPSGFWDEICGFNLNNLTVQPKYETLDPAIMVNAREFLINNQLSFIPYIDYKEGKNITAPFLINDMSVSKNGEFAEAAIKKVGEQIEVAGINSIYADNVILNNINENAYYLIEIESKFKNNLLTSDFGNMKNVAGIANTYFNSSNFTSTNSADSFIYQHTGEPQMLQSFGIRILDSTKNLATGLGPDNTVFIQIIKAPKIPPQLQSKEEKQIKGALREQHMAKQNN